jgi:sirohydrochlorin ferrochelatase
MGVDHEDDPAVPDRSADDHKESPAFDVWATREKKAGPALPDMAPYESEAEPVLSGQVPNDHQDDAPWPAPQDHEDVPDLPRRASNTAEAEPDLPHRPPRDQDDSPGLPRRTPSAPADSPGLPARGASSPHDGQALPVRDGTAPTDGSVLPRRDSGSPGDGQALPRRGASAPTDSPGLPRRGASAPTDSPGLPRRGASAPTDSPGLPRRGASAPSDGQALPVRDATIPGDGPALPVRTSRYRRIGRHASPHQLSLASDTPALVIAVPGSARPENEEIATRIAELAGGSCHGAEVRVGYLRGNKDHLEDVLDELGSAGSGPTAVVVPLLAFPNAEVDAAIADIVTAAQAPFLTAAHLGPHPLLAEAVHARLADAGLSRASRVGRISIVTAADGIIVGAAGEDDAVEGAGVVAVLLASRLTLPVAAASLTDPASIKDAATRLREARVARVALAPCMIGPELTSGTLDAIAALTSTECAPPLGSHRAVAELVAIRYGAALADPKVAALMAEARGEPLPATVPPSGAAT